MNDLGKGQPSAAPAWVRAFWIGALILLLAFVALHLTGHGHMHHGEMP